MSDDIDWEALLGAARQAQQHAYAPYSGFRVGAALLAENGGMFTGANVENASYGLGLCAERNAVATAAAAGARRFRALVVCVPGNSVAAPCGACRQVLAEFPPAFVVRCYADRGEPLITDTAALLPLAFKLDNKGGTLLR